MKTPLHTFMMFLLLLSACTVNDYTLDNGDIPIQNQLGLMMYVLMIT